MSKPRPKFCEGEEAYSIEAGCIVEITRLRWIEKGLVDDNGKTVTETGWYCEKDGTGYSDHEKYFKKIPPQQRAQWQDCAWQPKKEGVAA